MGKSKTTWRTLLFVLGTGLWASGFLLSQYVPTFEFAQHIAGAGAVGIVAGSIAVFAGVSF